MSLANRGHSYSLRYPLILGALIRISSSGRVHPDRFKLDQHACLPRTALQGGELQPKLQPGLTAAIRSPGGIRESHTDLVKLLEADAGEVFSHPRHEAAQKLLPQLISQLRACENVADGYEFQESLFAALMDTEEARNVASRAVKRLRAGHQLQSGAPEPRARPQHKVLLRALESFVRTR